MRISYVFFTVFFWSFLGLTGQAQTPRQSMNPDTSISVLTKFQNTKRKDEEKPDPDNGLSIEEVELQFLADIDPYLKGVAVIAIHPAHEHEEGHEHHGEEGEEHEEDEAHDEEAAEEDEAHATKYEIELEEVYVESISLPNITLKAGRFKAALGRHNLLHAHAFPFLDAPIIHQQLLGDHGLSDNGISAAGLLPLPWFSEITLQAFQGDSPELFASKTPNDNAKVGRFRNLFDLSEAITLDLGVSGATGANIHGGKTTVTAQDLSLKWRPAEGGKYTSLSLAAEALQGNIEDCVEGEKRSGYATWISYQFAERWKLQLRQEQAKIPHLVDEEVPADGTEDVDWRKVSVLLGFSPSEFSGFRLQWDQLHDDQDEPLNRIALQMNVVIGAHPAHSY